MDLQKVKSGIYKWGFYPALFLLREEQENENYQNCKVIKQALDEVGCERELSSKVDDISMEKTYNEVMKGLFKPNVISSNMPFYIEELRKHLNN